MRSLSFSVLKFCGICGRYYEKELFLYFGKPFRSLALTDPKQKNVYLISIGRKLFDIFAVKRKNQKGEAFCPFPLDKIARCDYIDFINAMSETRRGTIPLQRACGRWERVRIVFRHPLRAEKRKFGSMFLRVAPLEAKE